MVYAALRDILVVMILILIFGLVLACSPSFMIWRLAWKYLPHINTLSPLRMTGVCMILVFLTSMILNPELEMGILSLFFWILLLMLGWTLMLLLVGLIFGSYHKGR